MAMRSISRIVSDNAAAAPDRPVITFEGRSLTRRELDRRTNRLARAFQALGVVEGDLVTLSLPNGFFFYEAAVACWKLGATPQPISARLPLVEMQDIVDLAQPKLLVGGVAGLTTAGAAVTGDFEPDFAFSDEALPDAVSPCWKALTSGGSTGRPKLIVSIDPGQFDTDVQGYQMQLDETQLVPGPLYHNGPFAFSMLGLFYGHHLVVMPRFDAETALALMAEHGVNWLMTVPTMMRRIWQLGEDVRAKYDLSALRVIGHVAAPCPPWLKLAFIEWLGPERVHEIYGGTEGQGSTWITGTEWLAHQGSVGKPGLGSNIKIFDDDGNELPPGEVGEVYMLPDRGAGATYRYVGAEPKRRPDGWETLGDMGYMDADGYLYLTDRRADMILRGGANIYPAEVEAAIDAHPAIRSSVVIGLPDEDLGNRIHAIVDAVAPVTEADLRAFVATRLVSYKAPETWEFAEGPLRDDAGKARRSQLRAERIAARQAQPA